jgi:hypothetical protein
VAILLFTDVHVNRAIVEQLRRRGVDVLSATEDGCNELSDEELLNHSTLLNRLIFMQDIRFKAMAEQWQREDRTFAGLAFGSQLRGSIGQYVQDLEIIAKAATAEECKNVVFHLPF